MRINCNAFRAVFNPLAKMESRPPSKVSNNSPEEAVLGVSTVKYEPPYIKIASHTGGRDVSDAALRFRNHFRGAPFSFRPFSFRRAKENGQIWSNTFYQRFCGCSSSKDRSFSCLDTRERTKEKVKAGGKMPENFSTELKRIKSVLPIDSRGDQYSFSDAPLRNFLDGIFPQAIFQWGVVANKCFCPVETSVCRDPVSLDFNYSISIDHRLKEYYHG